MHTWEVGTGISSGIWGSGDLGLVSVECCKERVLERRVLGRLLEVIMHLASRREDTLHSCRTPADDAGAAKYCLTILASAGHFASRARHHLRMSSSQPGTSASSRYCSSSSRTTLHGWRSLLLLYSFLTRAPKRPLRKTFRCHSL